MRSPVSLMHDSYSTLCTAAHRIHSHNEASYYVQAFANKQSHGLFDSNVGEEQLIGGTDLTQQANKNAIAPIHTCTCTRTCQCTSIHAHKVTHIQTQMAVDDRDDNDDDGDGDDGDDD